MSWLTAQDPYRAVLRGYLAFTLAFGVLAPLSLHLYAGISPMAQPDWFRWSYPGYDFEVTYQAAANLRRGLSPYVESKNGRPVPLTDDNLNRYTYPPLQAYLLLPLSFLPFRAAYLAWCALTLGLLLLGLAVASRLYPRPGPALAAAVLLYAQSSFLPFELERGQTDALVFVCITFTAWCFFGRKKPAAAGVWCAVGTLLKMTPGIFLVSALVRRNIKAPLAFLAAGLALAALTAPGSWLDWIRVVGPHHAGASVGFGVDHSLAYLLEYAFSPPLARQVAPALWAALFLAFCGLLLAHRDRDRFFLSELAILSILMNIGTPWSANYKLLLLVFTLLSPFALLEYPWVRARPAFFLTPVFLSLALVVPASGFFLTRFFTQVLPTLLTAPDIPASQLASLFIEPLHESRFLDLLLTDRKVSLGLLAILAQLLLHYAASVPASLPRWLADNPDRLARIASRGFVAATAAVAAASVLIVVARPLRASWRANFIEPADLLDGPAPVSVKSGGLGPRERDGEVAFHWGLGPRTVVAFTLPSARRLTLSLAMVSPIPRQGVSLRINDALVGDWRDVPEQPADAPGIAAEVTFEGKAGLNAVELDYAAWNLHDALVSSADPRPFAVRFKRLRLRSTPPDRRE